MKNNSRRTHTLAKLFSTAGVIVIAFASLAALGATTYYARNYLLSDEMAAVIASVLVDLTNDDREDEGLGTLTVNPTLVAAAQAKANDMAEKSYFSHDSPDGKTPWYWFKQAGYSYAYAGENLAVNFSDSKDVERAWMDSPTHRANVLGQNFTEIGIATAVGTYKGKTATFVVQMFGRPTQSAVATAQAATIPPPRVVKPASEQVLGEETAEPVATEPIELEPVVTEAAVTESGEPPATVAATEPAPEYAPFWGGLATSPREVLRTVYALSAALLLLALLLTTGREFRKHHVRHVLAASVLVVFMGGLFVIADNYVFPSPVISHATQSLHEG